MVIKAVIGSSWGDEGKGLMTDYFCHQAQLQGKKCLNILTNGGAQRGHTVVHNGLRHVFHHFGSGTFSGADTFIPGTFVINPMVFVQEHKELINMGINPKVIIDDRCRITTPYDMMANKINLEKTGRHNSCGMGVWHTMSRYDDRLYDDRLIFNFFNVCLNKSNVSTDKSQLLSCLDKIRDYYLIRMKQQNITITKEWEELFYSEDIKNHFLSDYEYMIKHSFYYHINYDYFKLYDVLVFENAQGLLLDKSDRMFGTPSTTGCKIIFDRILPKSLLSEDNELELCYVTRSYLTRHGDGDLPGECSKEEISSKINDITNVYNECQGHLRYARLDVGSLMDRIHKDANKVKYNHKISLAVTHLDEYEIDIKADYKSYSPDSLKINRISE